MKNSKKKEDKKKTIIIPEGVTYHPEDEITLNCDVELKGTWVIGGKPENTSEFYEDYKKQFGVYPIHRTQSEPRKRKPALIDKIILYAFDRVIKSNSGIPPGIAQNVWDEINYCVEHDEFPREEPRYFNCIFEIKNEFIEYFPHPGQSDDSKFLKRKDFDTRLSRLRKRFR